MHTIEQCCFLGIKANCSAPHSCERKDCRFDVGDVVTDTCDYCLKEFAIENLEFDTSTGACTKLCDACNVLVGTESMAPVSPEYLIAVASKCDPYELVILGNKNKKNEGECSCGECLGAVRI